METYALSEPKSLPRQGEQADEPHRVLGRARGGRSARRRRTHGCRPPSIGTRPSPIASVSWDLGLGVAEAMDTAQRGMGLDWPHVARADPPLGRRRQAARGGALVFSGAGTDHLAPEAARSVDDVIRAYEEQFAAIEGVGGRIILMASRALARVAKSADDYVKVYDRILSQAKEPVIIHWLGDMFDPALAGYWGTNDLDAAMDTVRRRSSTANADKVDGVKISLLDKDKEIAMRRRLDKRVRMYTGDDFNYAELIAGDDQGYSHALLGIFDAIAPAASSALVSACGRQDRRVPRGARADGAALAAHLPAPTRFYKTGVVFMAYLNGHQDHFTMVGGQESARSTLHLAELFRLAGQGRSPAGSGPRGRAHALRPRHAWGGGLSDA